jgi:twitching motility protein PilJ
MRTISVESSSVPNSVANKISFFLFWLSFRFNSLGAKLFLLIMTGVLFGLGSLSYLFYKNLEKKAEEQILQSLNSQVSALEGPLQTIKQNAYDLATAVSSFENVGIESEQAYKNLAFAFFQKRPAELKAISFGQTAYELVPSKQWFWPFFYPDRGAADQPGKPLPAPYNNIIYSDSGGEEEYYPDKDYYLSIANTGKEVWMEPYYDTGSTISTFGCPIYNKENKLIGVVNADFNLTTLTELVKAPVSGESGFFAIVSEKGKLLAYPPDPEKVKKEVSYSEIPTLKDIWPQLEASLSQNNRGLIQDNRTNSYWAYRRINNTNWIMLANLSFDVTRRPAITIAGIGSLVATALIGFLVMLFIRSLNHRLKPILEDCNKLIKSDGELDIQLQGRDEIETLSISFYNLLAQVDNNQIQIRQEVARFVKAEEELKQNQFIQQEREALEREVNHLLDVVSLVQAGNLTARAQESDMITGLVARHLNDFIVKLAQIMERFWLSARHLNDSSRVLQQLTKVVGENSKQETQEANRVNNLTQEVEIAADRSSKQVKQALESILEIDSIIAEGQNAIEFLTGGIGILQQGSDRIVNRVKTMGDFVTAADRFLQEQNQIASLTQVLAMNATMVAARASEQKDPRQFLVIVKEFEAIAKQVNTLAQQTNDSLQSLQKRSSQIHTVASGITTDVKNMEGLVNGIVYGVEQSTAVFKNIQTKTLTVVQTGETINKSNQGILDAAQSTAQAMRDIVELAEKTFQLNQNTKIQSEAIGQLSQELLKTVEFFDLSTIDIEQNNNR